MGWGGPRYSQRGAFFFKDSTHPAGDVGDVGAAVELDVGAVLPDLRPQLDAVTAYAGTFSLSMIIEYSAVPIRAVWLLSLTFFSQVSSFSSVMLGF